MSNKPWLRHALISSAVTVALIFVGGMAWFVIRSDHPAGVAAAAYARTWWLFVGFYLICVVALLAARGTERLDDRVEAWRAARRERREDARGPAFATADDEIAALHDALQALAVRPLAFTAAHGEWSARVVATQRLIRRFRHAAPVPEFIHRWLADAAAGLRYRDAGDAARQATRFEHALARLRAGAMPTDAELGDGATLPEATSPDPLRQGHGGMTWDEFMKTRR
jgi:hypothetical protein